MGGVGASAIAAGQGFLEIFLKSDKLESGLSRISKNLSRWSLGIGAVGATITGMGAAIVAPLTAMADSVAESRTKLQEMTHVTGASAEALSELGFAAEQSGGDIDMVENALVKMNKSLGGSDAAKSLQAIGLSFKDLNGLSPDKQMEVIAEAISKLPGPAAKTAALIDIFGKQGAKLGPMFAEGAKGIRELREEAIALGLQANSEKTQEAKEYTNAWNRLGRVAKSIKSAIGGVLIPILTETADTVLKVIIPIRDFIKTNREWVAIIFKVGSVLTAVGTALSFVGAAGLVLAGVFAGLAKIGAIIAAVFGFIFSPIGLIIAGIAALAAGFIYLTGTGGTIIATIGGVAKALMSGQWALAGQIAMKGLQIVWLSGLNMLSNAWVRWKYFVFGVMDDLAEGVGDTWDQIVDDMKLEWAKIKNFLNPDFDVAAAEKQIKKERDEANGIRPEQPVPPKRPELPPALNPSPQKVEIEEPGKPLARSEVKAPAPKVYDASGKPEKPKEPVAEKPKPHAAPAEVAEKPKGGVDAPKVKPPDTRSKARKELDAAMEAELGAYDDQIKSAKADLDRLLAQVGGKKPALVNEDRYKMPPLKQKLELTDFASHGTFNGFAANNLARGTAVDSTAEKIVEGVEALNEKMDRLNDVVAQGGAGFGN